MRYHTVSSERKPRGRHASILMYHSVSERRDYSWSINLPRFEAHMRKLARSGLPVIPMQELARRLDAGESLEGAIVLTFDDGYQDNFTNALPVLRNYGLPATIFVVTELIGGKDNRGMQRLSRREIERMQKSGLITFAPHSKTHPRLIELSSQQVREEMEDSREALRAITGNLSPYFAYPYGIHDQRIVRLARSAGFCVAFTTRAAYASRRCHRLRMPRLRADSTLLSNFPPIPG